MRTHKFKLPVDDSFIRGEVTIPEQAKNLVIFLTGYSGPHTHEIHFLSDYLHNAGYATLWADLLTEKEKTWAKPADSDLLTRRIVILASWISNQTEYRMFKIAFMGIGGGVTSALKAAARLGPAVKALVLIDGRPDSAAKELPRVASPVQLIAPEYDFHAIKSGRDVLDILAVPKSFVIIPGASHFFEEPDKLELVAKASTAWYRKYMPERQPQAVKPITHNRLSNDERAAKKIK